MAMNRGSIALARSLCYEIAGPTDEDDDVSGGGYGSVDIAEILSAEIERLRAELEGLKRGEFICRKCGLRKDGERAQAEF